MLRYYYLTWLSQPAADRPLYKLLAGRTVHSILELGIGTGVRTQRLFETAVKPCHADSPLRYTGIDLFEARQHAESGLTLREAHRQLKAEHVTMKLVPGDPLSALARVANSLTNVDLMIVSLDQVGEALDQAWRYVPRMLHNESLVYLERDGKKPGETKFDVLTSADVARFARDAQRNLRRAA